MTRLACTPSSGNEAVETGRLKGFRPKTPGEKDTGRDPRIQAQLWERYFREARRLGQSWKGCMACPPERRDPGALLEVHHVVSQQRMKRWCRERGIPKGSVQELRALTDPRNSMLLDERCHSGHTSGLRRLDRGAIPSYAWAFAAEKDLTDEVMEEYPRRKQ
jgi:hypothetical protein